MRENEKKLHLELLADDSTSKFASYLLSVLLLVARSPKINERNENLQSSLVSWRRLLVCLVPNLQCHPPRSLAGSWLAMTRASIHGPRKNKSIWFRPDVLRLGAPNRGVRASLLRISPSSSTDLAECDAPRYPGSAWPARYHPDQYLRTRFPLPSAPKPWPMDYRPDRRSGSSQQTANPAVSDFSLHFVTS